MFYTILHKKKSKIFMDGYSIFCLHITRNKDENVHRYALSAISGEFLERERDSFGILYTGYLLSILRLREREIERERERERERE